MEAFANIFAFLAGLPAVIGLFVTALIIFLTSDWRLSLTALLMQYVLVGLILTRFIQPEVALVKILVGVLVVPILYLSARQMQTAEEPGTREENGLQFLGLQLGWDAGPLGFPLRLFAVLLVLLGLVRLLSVYRLPVVSTNVALVTLWLGSMGLIGLIVSGGPLRVALALLTILAGFDLVYAILEPSLAMVGFFGALTLLAALAFSYLAASQALASGSGPADDETA
jgi:MFS family permease